MPTIEQVQLISSLDILISPELIQPVDKTRFYRAAELAEAPQEAVDAALGCGNPLAIARLKPGETVLDIGSGGGLDACLAAKQAG